MERVPVESSSLRSVGYDEATETLEVEFLTGRVYRYENVPAQAHDWLMRSRGKGGYFNRMIRDRYAMHDVTPRPPETDLEARLRGSLADQPERDAT